MEEKGKNCCINYALHDCYAKGTKITLMTGENRDIENIRFGDLIRAMNDKCLVVSDIICGFESEICHITAENGCEIRVSKDHILKKVAKESSAEKNVCAKEVLVGDIVLSSDGPVRITSVQIEAYNDTVYNFIFQDETTPNFILTNGFWAGDFCVQQQINMEQRTQEDMEKQVDGFREEFEKLGNLFK